jgi:hypothetical protein
MLWVTGTKMKSLNRSRKVRQEEVLFTASGGKKLLLRVLRAFCLNFLHVQILAIDPRTRRGIFGSGTPERKCRDILFLPAGILCELRGLSLVLQAGGEKSLWVAMGPMAGDIPKLGDVPVRLGNACVAPERQGSIPSVRVIRIGSRRRKKP